MSQRKVLFIITTDDDETFRAGMLNASNLLAADVPVKIFISQRAVHLFTNKFLDAQPDVGDTTIKKRMSDAIKLGAVIIICRTAVSNYGYKDDDFIEGVDPSQGWMDIVDDQIDPDTQMVWIS